MSYANRGVEWQREVEDVLTAGAMAGRWEWQRNEPAKSSRWKDYSAVEEAIRRGAGVPDYTVLGRGWWAHVEAKDCAGSVFYMRGVSELQAERLTRSSRMGGAWVLLRLRGGVFLLPWAAAAEHWYTSPKGRFTPACGWGLEVGAAWADVVEADGWRQAGASSRDPTVGIL